MTDQTEISNTVIFEGDSGLTRREVEVRYESAKKLHRNKAILAKPAGQSYERLSDTLVKM